MTKMFKVGIIGCGGIANQKHLPSIKNTKRAQIIAFCDIVEEKALKASSEYGVSDAFVCTDYKELLALDLDIVYVCTPNRSHSFITVDALHSGKHVMCEKPMAINSVEAQRMVDAAIETKKILTIGYQNRYRPDSQLLKAECKDDRFGDIYFAKAQALRRRGVPTWGVFLNESEQGGGPLIDIGTHALDLTLWMMENYKVNYVVGSVFHKLNDQKEPGNPFGDWDPEDFTVEDSAFGFVVMENGATIILESSWALNILGAKEARTLLCGTKAGADMEDGLRINGVKHNKQYIETSDLSSSGVAFFSGLSSKAEDIEQHTFFDAIEGKGELCVKPEQALVVTQILEAIYQSSKDGTAIYFKEGGK